MVYGVSNASNAGARAVVVASTKGAKLQIHNAVLTLKFEEYSRQESNLRRKSRGM